jgi:hypothetical protein
MSGCGYVDRPIKNGHEFGTKINLTRKEQKQRNVFYDYFIFIMLIIRHSNPTISGTSHESCWFLSLTSIFRIHIAVQIFYYSVGF